MIPKIIHYVWIGGNPKPELVERCMESWHKHMPDWQYREWNEQTIADYCAQHALDNPLTSNPYTSQALNAKKYAFVSDYIRLWALEREGGVYLDTDVEVLRSYEPLLSHRAFIGWEEAYVKTLGTNCIGSEPHMPWLVDQLAYYDTAVFLRPDGSLDMTANSEIIARNLSEHGLVRDGSEQEVDDLHVFDYHYFSPITSTRVMRKNANTYSIHHFAGSWTGRGGQHWYDHPFFREITNALVQLKRKLKGQK